MTRRSIFAVSMLAVLCSLAMTGCGSKDTSSSSTTSTTKVTTSSTSSAIEESSVNSLEQENTPSSVEEDVSSAEESESSAEESVSSENSTETSSEDTSDEDSDSAFEPDVLMSELQNSDIGLVVSELSSTGTATVDGVEVPITSFGAASSYGKDFYAVEQYIYVDGKFASSNLYVYAGTLSTPEEICDATYGHLSVENFEVVPESETPCWYVSSAPSGIGCAYVSPSMTDTEAYDAVQEAIVKLKELV